MRSPAKVRQAAHGQPLRLRLHPHLDRPRGEEEGGGEDAGQRRDRRAQRQARQVRPRVRPAGREGPRAILHGPHEHVARRRAGLRPAGRRRGHHERRRPLGRSCATCCTCKDRRPSRQTTRMRVPSSRSSSPSRSHCEAVIGRPPIDRRAPASAAARTARRRRGRGRRRPRPLQARGPRCPRPVRRRPAGSRPARSGACGRPPPRRRRSVTAPRSQRTSSGGGVRPGETTRVLRVSR